MSTAAKTAFRLWSWLRRSPPAPQPLRQPPPRVFIRVDITPHQRDLLRACWRELDRQPHRSGQPGAVIAQVHKDSLCAFVLTHEQALAMRRVLGGVS